MPPMIERIGTVTVNGTALPPYLCTPEHLDELAVGSLFVQGMIHSAADVLDIHTDELNVSVRIAFENHPSPLSLAARLESLCVLPPSPPIPMDDAQALMVQLADYEVYFGTHCIALRTPGEIHFREDIGRHNALDKVIGRGLMDNIDFGQCVMAATGRISLEMLIKTASACIPCIVTKKYPSDLAVEHAQRLGIHIIGNALSPKPVLYA